MNLLQVAGCRFERCLINILLTSLFIIGCKIGDNSYFWINTKVMRLIIGIILLVGGSYFGYNGYQLKQTSAAKFEREASALAKTLTGDKVSIESDTNTEADIQLFGGGGVAVVGLVLILSGLTRKGKKKR